MFEYPHFNHEYYYGLRQHETVQKLLQNLQHSGKDIAKKFKSEKSPLYRDTEKIHLQFLAVKEGNTAEFMPVYIGIGTNEPFNLTQTGAFGKSRFLKYSFLEQQTGIETWQPEKIATPKEITEQLPEQYHLFETYNNGERKVYSIIETRKDDFEAFDFGIYDEESFKGFLECDYETKHTYFIIPKFHPTHIDPLSHLKAVKNGTPSIQSFQIPKNPKDITNILATALDDYEYYAATALDPLYLVKKHGIDACYEKTAHKLDSGEFNFTTALNVASDIYNLSVDEWHRLKCSALLYAHLEKEGKLEDILHNVL